MFVDYEFHQRTRHIGYHNNKIQNFFPKPIYFDKNLKCSALFQDSRTTNASNIKFNNDINAKINCLKFNSKLT